MKIEESDGISSDPTAALLAATFVAVAPFVRRVSLSPDHCPEIWRFSTSSQKKGLTCPEMLLR